MLLGKKLVPETSESLKILKRLSVRENFIENHALLCHVLFKCFEFLSENKVHIFSALKLETSDINAVMPLGKVRRTLKICLRNSIAQEHYVWISDEHPVALYISLRSPRFRLYGVIQKDGLNFVRLYFLNYTWYVNDLHNI